MIVADMNQLTLAGWEKEENRERMGGVERKDDRRQLRRIPWGTISRWCTATSVWKWLSLK
jgi:hypothetical protein